jgi:hypothetical protein
MRKRVLRIIFGHKREEVEKIENYIKKNFIILTLHVILFG